MKKFFLFIFEVVKVVIVSLAIIIPVRYFLIQPFFVRGASMEPNFNNGDYLIVDELSYRVREPERGEVIVFRYPLNPSSYYIKRIIGLPGETIEIKDSKVVIYNKEFPNGIILDESEYLKSGQATWGNVKMELEKDEYFVMGDNRNASSDSRRWGPVPKKYIIGRVWIRAWPFSHAAIF